MLIAFDLDGVLFTNELFLGDAYRESIERVNQAAGLLPAGTLVGGDLPPRRLAGADDPGAHDRLIP